MIYFAQALLILCLNAMALSAHATMPTQSLQSDPPASDGVPRAATAGVLAVDKTDANPLSELNNQSALVATSPLVSSGAVAMGAASEDASSSGLGLVLSSWGVVALIAIRRLVG